MKSPYSIFFSLLLISSLSFAADKLQCTPDGVCTSPAGKASSLVPPVAGSGPSFKPGTSSHEGHIVKPSQFEKPAGQASKPYPKQLWANSFLFRELPLLSEEGKIEEDQKHDKNLSAVDRINGYLKIESWYNHKPADFKGKFVLIEFAASWCSACKRSLKHIERIHATFPTELVVISIFETDALANNDFPRKGEGENIKHSVGIDTQRRCANALGVYGIPHAVLIEPESGVIVWEGMIHQIGYELSDNLLKKFFAIGLKK
ncbi:MAG: TlpA disulfide reductase family protein [Kiritimatiellae bacterium]|jgi:cytochrome c biogenesis protein CcmG/thiol:disulfide interchange protein DsbE|nr:TlpA disulfide reductase family protein [Kiritimatiellia bacterium]